MKQRSIVVAVAAMMPLAAGMAQQTPPTPPPASTTIPAEPARPAVAPLPATTVLPGQMDLFDREEMLRMAEDARREGLRAAEEARRFSRDYAEEARIAGQRAAEEAGRAMRDFNFDFKFDMPRLTGQAFAATAPLGGQHFYSSHAEIGPPPSFGMQGDPADSIYSLAREAFNRQDYSRAAARFAEVIAKYPSAKQVAPSAYYQAFSLYRIGTLETLRTALKVLETNFTRFQYASNSSYSANEAANLQARVLRALSERKEPSADEKLRDLVAKYPAAGCDKEKIDLQANVLSSYFQTDPDGAMPIIRQNLGSKDKCTARLREMAVFTLSRRPTEESTSLIVQIAKTDTVQSVRRAAIEGLSRMPGDVAVSALQQFMADSDEDIQSAAVRSLMRNDSPKARAAMRTLIDRRDAPEKLRIEAIQSYDRENIMEEDAAFLRGLYNRQGESDRVKSAIIRALSQAPSEQNMAFLLNVAKDQNETSSLRSSALRSVTSRQNLSTDDLIKLYDASDSRSMRNSLVDALGQRPEQAAITKLLDIVKLSTDPEVRTNAIQILLRKKDPKINEQVLALISK